MSTMSSGAFPDDVDYVPPHNIVKLIAKQTYQLDAPLPIDWDGLSTPVESVSSSLIEDSPDGYVDDVLGGGSAWSSRSGAGSRLFLPAEQRNLRRLSRGSLPSHRSGLAEGRADSPSSVSSDESFQLDEMVRMSLNQNHSPGFSTPRSSLMSDYGPNATNLQNLAHQNLAQDSKTSRASAPLLTNSIQSVGIHSVGWDSVVRPSKDLYSPATAEVCACRTPFDNDASFCKRCGNRRPVHYPTEPDKVTKAISLHRREQGVIDRQFEWAGLYASRLYALQLQKLEECEKVEREQYFTPRLNPKSEKIVKSKKRAPLSERAGDIIESRRRKLEQQREEAEKAALKEMQKGPAISDKAKHVERSLKNLTRWEINKRKVLRHKQERRLEVEAKQCTFHPFISAHSHKLARDYERQPVYKRLHQDSQRREIRELMEDSEFLFAPHARVGDEDRPVKPHRNFSPDVFKGRFDWEDDSRFKIKHEPETRPHKGTRASTSCIPINLSDLDPTSAEDAKLEAFKANLRRPTAAIHAVAGDQTALKEQSAVSPAPTQSPRSMLQKKPTKSTSQPNEEHAAGIGTSIGNTFSIKCTPKFYAALEIAHRSYDLECPEIDPHRVYD